MRGIAWASCKAAETCFNVQGHNDAEVQQSIPPIIEPFLLLYAYKP
jgi:hypothetical protein